MARKPKKTYTQAQKLRDPAKRSKLPMSALTPKQRQQRKQNQRVAADNANPLYDPSAILGGHALYSAASHITDAVLKPKEAALAAQIGMTTTQGTALADRSRGYYQTIAAGEGAALAKQKALDDARKTALRNIGTTTQANIDKSREQEQSLISNRDPASQGSSRVLDELAASKASAATRQGAAEAESAAHATNQQDFLGNFYKTQGARGAEVGGEMLNRLANQIAPLNQQKADLASGRGDELAKNLLTLRQSGFENAATMEGLGIKRTDLQAQIADDKRQATIARQKITSAASTNAANRRSREQIAADNRAIDKQRIAETHRHNVVAETKPAKGEKEPATATTIKRQVTNLGSEIKEAVRVNKVSGGTPVQRRRAAAALIRARAKRAKSSVPDDVLSAAIDLALDGHVSKRNRAILRESHVQIPKEWLPKKRAKRG